MAAGIRLIVGLGNPGAKYVDTRHNAGFWWLDRLASRHAGLFRSEAKFFAEVCRIRADGEELWLLKPSTYMNASGRAVAALTNFYKIGVDEILVAHDELDLPPGALRLKRGGGHGGHNGIRDIASALGADFWRLRIGIGHPGDKAQVSDFVLHPPSRSEAELVLDAVDRASPALPHLLRGDFDAAMRHLNIRPKPEKKASQE